MIEFEIYAVGLREDDKILQLDHQLDTLHGIRYQADANHDIVYFEMDQPTVTLNQINDAFRRIGLEPRFVGLRPPELQLDSGGATIRIE